MIKFLPPIYPDESVYSYLCRLYIRSGFLWHRGFAAEVFSRWSEIPEYNFTNALNNEFKITLEGYISLERLVMEHTLFSYYARFLPQERRVRAFTYAMKNKPFIHKYLPIPNGKSEYYLRYCPMCVEVDRERYGESYFHIQHQIPSVHVCPLHNCILVDTAILNTKRRHSSLFPLEQIIAENGIDETVEYEADNINIRVARYINEVLHQPLDLDAETLISDYLTVKLKDEYVSPRGEQRNLVELDRDMAIYFNGLKAYDITKQRLAHIFRNNSFTPYNILLVAMFEEITPQALCSLEGYIEPKHVTFDKKVRELREQGRSYCEIADTMNICHEAVKKILSGVYDKVKRSRPHRCQKWDWETIDGNCCREFKNRVESFIAQDPNCRISKPIVAEWFGLKDKSLRNLPRLQQLIKAYKK